MSPSTDGGAAARFRPAIPDIIEEHLEELAYGAIRLRSLTFSDEAPAARLSPLANRCGAHRQGLRIGADTSRALAERLLTDGAPPWILAAAVWTWCELTAPDALALAVSVQDVPPDQIGDWREGLRWLPVERLIGAQSEALRSERPLVFRHLLLDVLGWHARLDAATASAASRDPQALVRWPIARHAGHGFTPDLALPLLRRLVDDADQAVRSAALWSLALIDRPAALAIALRSADPVALRVQGELGDETVVPVLAAALGDSARCPAALAALVDHGSRAALDAVLTTGDQGLSAASAIVGPFDSAAGADGARAAWPLLSSGDLRLRRGLARPWTGRPDDRPMRWAWQAAIAGDPAVPAGLRREVPDGFLAGTPRDDVEVGA